MVKEIKNTKTKFTITHIEKLVNEFNELQKKLGLLLEEEGLVRVRVARVQNQIKNIEIEFDVYLSELYPNTETKEDEPNTEPNNMHFAKWVSIINSHISDRKIKEKKSKP